MTALHIASYKTHIGIVNYLVSKKKDIDVNVQDEVRLLVAIMHDHHLFYIIINNYNRMG